jgi:hypothetical protein
VDFAARLAATTAAKKKAHDNAGKSHTRARVFHIRILGCVALYLTNPAFNPVTIDPRMQGLESFLGGRLHGQKRYGLLRKVVTRFSGPLLAGTMASLE